MHLQGVWAFIIFVCKRNVIKVLRGKSNRLYSIARQMSRQMSSQCQHFRIACLFHDMHLVGGGSHHGGNLARGTLTPQSTLDKTEDMSITASVNEAPADTQL